MAVTTLELILLVGTVIGVGLLLRRKNLPLPPGPKGLPLVGNIFDMPQGQEALKWQQMGREIGSDVIYLNVLGTSIVVINSLQAAHDLFERKSAIYSDRPHMVMMNELVGFGTHFTFMPYGDRWRERRKLFHQHYQASAIPRYQSQITKGTRAFLRRLLDTPASFMDHVNLMAGEVIMDITYGLQVKGMDDPYVMMAEKALHAGTAAAQAGGILNIIPALKHLPLWVPGFGFLRQAREWKKSVTAAAVLPLQTVKTAMATGEAKPSVTLSLLNNLHENSNPEEAEDMLSTVAAAAYIGGSHTTVGVIETFLLAMVLYPEVQRKAQEALDRVVGRDRLPELSDRDALPYITAVLKESLRWSATIPLGLPHRLTTEDEYRGYRIPAGSIIIGNIWGMLRDENVFPEPDVFKPERFLKADGQLDPEVTDPDVAVFGFGRRVCPGKHLALSSIWLSIASVLATISISKAIDGNGNVIEPSGEYKGGLVSQPCPFECVFKARSAATDALIRSAQLEWE